MARTRPHGSKPAISIVIPVFNEERNIAAMYRALSSVEERMPQYSFQIIFVDDGSADHTWEAVALLAGAHADVEGIRFTRNFGKEAALEAGFRAAEGDAVIALDGDLQHPPELIPELVAAWQEGNDIVGTRHRNKTHSNIFMRFSSFVFYRLLNYVSDTPIEPGSSDFCLVSRRVADQLNAFPEKQKFHRILTHWVGFRSVSIPYMAGERQGGASVYTPRKLFSLARRAIISSSTLPMTLIFLLGCALALFGGMLTGGLMLYKYFVDWEYIGGAALLAAFIIFNNGLLFIAFGIMSLYQAATYREVQNRPSYIIEERV